VTSPAGTDQHAPPTVDPLRCWLGYAGFYVASFGVLGAQTLARTLAGTFWAQQVDRRGDARGVLLALSSAALVAFALFGALPALWAVLAAFVFGSVFSPMYPIVDAAAMRAASTSGYSFGRVRMVGSIAYLAAILAVGAWLDARGFGPVFPLVAGGIALMVVAAAALPRRHAPLAAPAGGVAPWWSLLASRPLLWLLVATALIQGSHATFYNFSAVHWIDHGISKTVAGAIWAEGILAEIVLFYVAPRTVDRLRPTTLLMIGAAAAIVRWLVVGSTTSLPWLFATGWLHALSFACTYLGSLRALERRVPPHQRATAQGLLGAASSGVGMAVCGVLGGFVYDRWAGRAFLTMAAFAALGGLLAWRLRRQADAASRQPPASATSSPA
jgi:PPP family 3-phenylpropionic acid transporter